MGGNQPRGGNLKHTIEKIQGWNKRAEADNPDAAVFKLFYDYCNEKYYLKDGNIQKLSVENCLEGIRFAQNHLPMHQ